MPQPKKPSSPRSSPSRRSSSSRGASAKRSGGRARGGGSAGRGAESVDEVRGQLAKVRDALARSLMLPGEMVRETLEDAVRRGRMTRDDAEDLVQRLVEAGRRQTEEVLGEVEDLLGRGRDAASPRGARDAATAAGRAARRAPGADRVLREVDRARRVAGLGTSFPITGYDDLTAAQITDRLDELSPAELRKVRDYERRNANRKTVLNAVERKLG